MRPCIFRCKYLHQRLCLYEFYVGMNADAALCSGQSALEHACFLEDLSLTHSESSESLRPPLYPICATAMNDLWPRHPNNGHRKMPCSLSGFVRRVFTCMKGIYEYIRGEARAVRRLGCPRERHCKGPCRHPRGGHGR